MTDRVFTRTKDDPCDVEKARVTDTGWVEIRDETDALEALLSPYVVREIHIDVEDTP